MYHVSPRHVRESILLHGIDWRYGTQTKDDPGNYPDGNYLFHEVHPQWKGDVWLVDVAGLTLRSDPWASFDKSYDGAMFTPTPINVARLQLLTT